MTEGRRAVIVAAARDWLGTPYRHQASAKGAGADCLGLVRGVWREVLGSEPETPPPYSPDWMEASREERLFDACRRLLVELPTAEAGPGDVLLFRMRAQGPAKHLGILVETGGDEPRMIHAYSGRGVVGSSLGPSWRRRIAAAFSFPE
ncbi:NlpC/P60 family protein [Albimonas pacifica]|uniref:Putative phage cell wall peptidase, NlpC/P60 family n=1 Tax=Albimonas pacifica TaxID=1114924 RepID=A0A1I3GLZ4_9RHOB|nr:NlpC/P60 family protein [Albimonas pacifica]SFI24469.1 putative phage cell wall peptidase, NlpC/P60 family [Albimonas pacifica]